MKRLSQDLRAEIYKELRDLAASVRTKARELSKIERNKDAARALALAAVAEIWAKEWE